MQAESSRFVIAAMLVGELLTSLSSVSREIGCRTSMILHYAHNVVFSSNIGGWGKVGVPVAMGWCQFLQQLNY